MPPPADDRSGPLSVASIASVLSTGSIVSVASAGSIASIASAGSIASFASIGSIASYGRAGAILNVPVAAIALTAAWRRLEPRARARRPGLADRIGQVVAALPT